MKDDIDRRRKRLAGVAKPASAARGFINNVPKGTRKITREQQAGHN